MASIRNPIPKYPSSQFVPWSELEGKCLPMLNSIRKRWKNLLGKNLNERYYHDFISTHAHLLFPAWMDSIQIVSKIRLGAEMVTDFVQVSNEASYGLSYSLIEIETPWASPFTKDGIASARLNRAVHQVLGWRRWLEEHSSEARRLFPTDLHLYNIKSTFGYTIVIGTRENSKKFLRERNDFAHTLGISIRSFDWLTDRLYKVGKARRMIGDYYFCGGAEEERLSSPIKNALVNPFVKAMSDPQWREFISSPKFDSCHLVGTSADHLISSRTSNSYERRFLKMLQRNNKFRSDQ